MNHPAAAARSLTNTIDVRLAIAGERPARSRRTCVLILAAEWRLPYRTVRCAARCFDQVHILGTRNARPLARTLASHSFHELTTAQFGSASVSQIDELSAALQADIVIPSDTLTTRFLAAHGPALQVGSYPLPDEHTFDLLNDKRTFIDLCRRLDIPVPLTEVLSDRHQLLRRLHAGAMGLPLVAKPTTMEGNRGVKILGKGNARRLAAGLKYRPIMAQEFVAGRDLCAFYFCRKGRVEVEALYHNGGHFLEFIEHGDVSAYCRRIIRATNYTGVIGFDIRQRPNGDLCFLECNPRFWYNMELVMLAGLNFVELGLTDEQPRKPGDLVGKAILRAPGLLWRRAAPQAALRSRLAVLRFLADDAPMMAAIGLSKIRRTFFGDQW